MNWLVNCDLNETAVGRGRRSSLAGQMYPQGNSIVTYQNTRVLQGILWAVVPYQVLFEVFTEGIEDGI